MLSINLFLDLINSLLCCALTLQLSLLIYQHYYKQINTISLVKDNNQIKNNGLIVVLFLNFTIFLYGIAYATSAVENWYGSSTVIDRIKTSVQILSALVSSASILLTTKLLKLSQEQNLENSELTDWQRRLARDSTDCCALLLNSSNVDLQKKSVVCEELLEKVKQEETMNLARMSYMSCVAHDLKTPLQSFCCCLDLLKDTNPTEEQAELIETAEVSTDLMRLTISQTMDINKAISGKGLIPRRTTISLTHVLRRVGIIICGYDKEVPISFCIEEKVSDAIITDEEWLWQMILNLLTNACKYTQEGSIQIHIKVLIKENNHMLRFEVHDTGVGINETKAESLFKAFNQAQEGASTGTGLGLFGLKSRVEGLGGDCGAYPNSKSATGSGSVFWFNIPYVEDSMIEKENLSIPFNKVSILPNDRSILRKLSGSFDSVSDDRTSSLSLRESTDCEYEEDSTDSPTTRELSMARLTSRLCMPYKRSTCPLTAIIIDDALSIRKMLTKVLFKIGFEQVFSFENGYKGLEAIKKMEVDAVLTDIQMPVMTGPEMVKRFRLFEKGELISGRRTRRQLVIAITANATETTASTTENNFDFIFAKPLNINVLREIAQNCVEKRKILFHKEKFSQN